MRDWMRTTGGTSESARCSATCDAGPFGSDAPEDHRFLIDLRNLSIEPVTVRVAGEAEGFLVQGISVLTIQRTAEPGQELVFEALIDESVLIQIAASRYTPPSDATPRRRVSWNGADLECLNWE